MWDDEGFETSDSVRETVDWMDELRREGAAEADVQPHDCACTRENRDHTMADCANASSHWFVGTFDGVSVCEVCGVPEGSAWMFTGEASAAARLLPRHTLTWALAELTREARENCADVTFRSEAELIAHVRDVIALRWESWAPGAAIFHDFGDDTSLAYLVALRATDDEIAALVNS